MKFVYLVTDVLVVPVEKDRDGFWKTYVNGICVYTGSYERCSELYESYRVDLVQQQMRARGKVSRRFRRTRKEYLRSLMNMKGDE